MTDIAEFDLSHAGRRVTGHGLDAWLAEARELARLAIPLVFTQLAQMAIMTTDVIMLGHFSTSALASEVNVSVPYAGVALPGGVTATAARPPSSDAPVRERICGS